MPADTPAPSALDALARAARDAADREDPILALLKDVEDVSTLDVRWAARLVGAAPRLAAIVRVLREKASALVAAARVDGVATTRFVLDALDELDAALARAEAIAKGE